MLRSRADLLSSRADVAISGTCHEGHGRRRGDADAVVGSGGAGQSWGSMYGVGGVRSVLNGINVSGKGQGR